MTSGMTMYITQSRTGIPASTSIAIMVIAETPRKIPEQTYPTSTMSELTELTISETPLKISKPSSVTSTMSEIITKISETPVKITKQLLLHQQ